MTEGWDLFSGTMMTVPQSFQDREYQTIATDALWNYFFNNTGNPIIAMPTGTGKSVVQARFLQRVFHHYPTQRVLCLTHVKELIKQNHGRLVEMWPTAPAGIYSASLKQKVHYMPITFGGVMSVKNVIEIFGHIDLVLIDECHLVSPDGATTYQNIIKVLRGINPYLKVIGFTATWWRMGQGNLTDDGLFTDIAINMTDYQSFNWFLDQGYLIPLIPRPTNTTIDMTGVQIGSDGDYQKSQLQTAVEKVTYDALYESMSHCGGRRKWLVFCAGNQNAEHAAQILNSFGVRTTFIHDKVKDKERDDRIDAYRNGFYTAITNNNILTTGFDDREVDFIIMLRKTMSPGLWVQMLGRGTRPDYPPGYDLSTREGRLTAIHFSQKQNTLVLDFARNTRDLGPINDPVIPKRKGHGGGDAPIKICPNCGAYNHLSARVCCDCGEEFDMSLPFQKTAGTEELIRSDAPVFEWFNVLSIIYNKHLTKNGGIPMLKVTYVTRNAETNEMKWFYEWWGFQHTNNKFMLHKAHEWWRTRSYQRLEPPTTVDDVLKVANNELRRPLRIRVWTNKPYPDIMNYEYE